MQSAIQRTLIDPIDTRVLLTDVFDAETKFLDAARHANHNDAKDMTTNQGKYFVWLIIREDLENCVEAREATTETLKFKDTHITKLIQLISEKALEYLDL